MTRKEHLEFCKKCTQRHHDSRQGIICKITGKIADFDPVCSNYNEDETVANEPKVVYTENPGTLSLSANLDTLNTLRQYQDFYYALIGGGLAAVIGGIIWSLITVATNYQIGYMAIGVGLLVGHSVGFFGAGIDKKFGVLGAVLSLLGCIIGNFLSQVGFIAQSESMGYFEVISYLTFPLIKNIMLESFNFMDVLFYGIALFEGYKFAFRKVTNHMVDELNRGVIDGKPVHHKLRMPLTIASIMIISFLGFKIFSGVSGMKTFYYESGAKMSEGEMSHSKEDGHWIYYYENGNKQVEATFDNGVMDGEWKWYDENGVLTKLGHYQNGLESGSWMAYYQSGVVSDSCGYEGGRMHGHTKSWYESGILANEGDFVRNKLEGKCSYYYENGNLSSEGLMKKGVQFGDWKSWYANGELSLETTYTEDGTVLINNFWDEKGSLMVKDGNGIISAYKEEGSTLLTSGKVENGYKVGIWKIYSNENRLIEEDKYVDNKTKVWNAWDKNGKQTVKDGKGEYVGYYEGTDMVCVQGKVENGDKEGMWTTYYQMDKQVIMMEEEYHAGIGDGSLTSYYASGQVSSSGMQVNGKHEGEWKWYYESGTLSSVVNYKDGEKEGIQKMYSELGQLSKEEEYENGVLVSEEI